MYVENIVKTTIKTKKAVLYHIGIYLLAVCYL